MTAPVAARRRRLLGAAALAAVPVTFLLVFYAVPVATILARGLGEASPVAVWRRRSTGEVLWFTLGQAALSTVLAVAVGLPAAWAVGRRALPGRHLLRAALIVPFVLPTLVVGAAVEATFDRIGLDTGTVGAILVAHVVFNTAVVVRVVGGHWALLDPRQEEAARVLGAPRRRVAWEVTRPRLTPALWSAASIVFLFCFTSFGIILTVGGPTHPTLETEIWRHATQRTDIATAAALAVLQMIVVAGLLVGGSALERRAAVPAHTRGAASLRPVRGGRDALLVGAAVLPALLLVAVPLVVMVERSLAGGDGGYGLQHYRALGEAAGTGLVVSPLRAVGTSLTYAVGASIVAVVVGGLAGLAAAGAGAGGAVGAGAATASGGRQGGPWRRAAPLDLLVMLPLGTSAVTLGFGFLVAFDDPPVDWRQSRWLVVVAQALVGIPFVVRATVPALRAVDPRAREAAAVLGAGPARARWEVESPVVARSLVVGAAFAFAVSLGEFGATSFVARPDAPTVPIAMYRMLGRPGEALHGQAMALGVVLAVLTTASAALIERLRPRDAVGW